MEMLSLKHYAVCGDAVEGVHWGNLLLSFNNICTKYLRYLINMHLSQQPPVANGSSARGGASCSPDAGIVPGLNRLRTRACCHNRYELMCAIACPAVSGKRCFPVVIIRLWVSQSFQSLFYDNPQVLGERVWYQYLICAWSHHNLFIAALLAALSLWVNHHLPLEVSLVRVEIYINH